MAETEIDGPKSQMIKRGEEITLGRSDLMIFFFFFFGLLACAVS